MCLKLISIVTALFFILVNSQDVGQDPKDGEPVEIMSVDKISSDKRWENFKLTFDKKYPNIEIEQKRRKIFETNVNAINQHNEKYNRVLQCGKNISKSCLGFDVESADELRSICGINEMTDMTNKEVSQNMTGFKLSDETSSI